MDQKPEAKFHAGDLLYQVPMSERVVAGGALPNSGDAAPDSRPFQVMSSGGHFVGRYATRGEAERVAKEAKGIWFIDDVMPTYVARYDTGRRF